jgi:type VI secretion system protein VasD
LIARRALLAVAALAAATAASGPPPPAVGMLTIIAGADQNPGTSGNPAPVAIRVYELAASAKFERADVFALTESEQQTLGADDLGSEEFVLRPGETRVVTRGLKAGTQMIGVVVLFRDIDHAVWRAVAPVGVSGPTHLVLRTTRLGVTLTGA